MAIPKMKLYRLDESYGSGQASDYAALNDDELLPVVEKEVHLSLYEPLTCVAYRDLMAGRRAGERQQITLSVATGEDGVAVSGIVDCTRWCQAGDAIEVEANGTVLDPRLYRLGFDTADALYDAADSDADEHFIAWLADATTEQKAAALAIRRRTTVRVELGKRCWWKGKPPKGGLIYPFDSDEAVENVTVRYWLFTDNLASGAGALTLQRGRIYDGRRTGRIGKMVDGAAYRATWATEDSPEDMEGIPKKAEGNTGFRLRAYPCRQLVALRQDAASAFVADCEITAAGAISLTTFDCGAWLVAKTDPRRPRLFELLPGSTGLFHELEEGAQYEMTVAADAQGHFTVSFQLSAAYYTPAPGDPLYPAELFIRYNEPDDLLESPLTPDYLDYDANDRATPQAGLLQAAAGFNAGKAAFRRFILALATPRQALGGAGTDGMPDLTRTDSPDGTATIDLAGTPFAALARLTIYSDGKPFYVLGNAQEAAPYTVAFPTDNGHQLVQITPKTGENPPGCLLLSCDEEVAIARAASNGANPAAWGWRLCCYEKADSGRLFVSSHRNWVVDHLNNNPDIFWGFEEYAGAQPENTPQISFVERSDYTIDSRAGAVEFAETKAVVDYDAVRNFPEWTGASAGEVSSLTLPDLRPYLGLAFAKFAYYDGIRDIADGLLRECVVADGAFIYRLLEDPIYAGLEDRQWLVRNDDALPQAFSYRNAYIPTPEYETAAPAEPWEAFSVAAGQKIQLAFKGGRSIALSNALAAPTATGLPDGTEDTVTARLGYTPAYAGDTNAVEAFEAGSAEFIIRDTYWYSAAAGRWERQASEIYPDGNAAAAIPFASLEFDPAKTIAENIAARRAAGLLYTPAIEAAPYTLRFVTGETHLLIEALERN